jgi:Tfp pilus assembly protein FimT
MLERPKGKAGFTLLEALTGVLLTAAVAGIALPNMSQVLRSYQLTTAANQIGFEISRARMQAAAQARYACVYVAGGMIERRIADLGQTDCSAASSWEASALPSQVSASTAEIRFDPAGLAVVRQSVRVQTSDDSKTITTDLLGGVTIS